MYRRDEFGCLPAWCGIRTSRMQRAPRFCCCVREKVCPDERALVQYPEPTLLLPSGDVAAGRSEKSVEQASRDALFVPAEDQWHVVGVCETTAAADVALNVDGEIVFCEGKCCNCGVVAPPIWVCCSLTQTSEFISIGTEFCPVTGACCRCRLWLRRASRRETGWCR